MILKHLADHSVPCNVASGNLVILLPDVELVAGFFHDHLFIPEGREQEVMALLMGLARVEDSDSDSQQDSDSQE